MTPAETLRAAAAKVREAAGAGGTPGPWVVGNLGPAWGFQARNPAVLTGWNCGDTDEGGPHRFVVAIAQQGGSANAHDAAWIALMGPQVAEPLAAWLDTHGRDLESAGGKLSATDSPADVRHAIDLARAILGGGE